eukprot:TRINITY_DN4428_c0_g3_i2.p1 TRINITY_DN4428_c0_g3~~TRINITY_DN4428_c0_g3_i2.p1  ORF type:complete len:562 (+),score=97.45 TRINITY_DN4428_c0_g3_i2:169-1854(+)
MYGFTVKHPLGSKACTKTRPDPWSQPQLVRHTPAHKSDSKFYSKTEKFTRSDYFVGLSLFLAASAATRLTVKFSNQLVDNVKELAENIIELSENVGNKLTIQESLQQTGDKLDNFITKVDQMTWRKNQQLGIEENKVGQKAVEVARGEITRKEQPVEAKYVESSFAVKSIPVQEQQQQLEVPQQQLTSEQQNVSSPSSSDSRFVYMLFDQVNSKPEQTKKSVYELRNTPVKAAEILIRNTVNKTVSSVDANTVGNVQNAAASQQKAVSNDKDDQQIAEIRQKAKEVSQLQQMVEDGKNEQPVSKSDDSFIKKQTQIVSKKEEIVTKVQDKAAEVQFAENAQKKKQNYQLPESKTASEEASIRNSGVRIEKQNDQQKYEIGGYKQQIPIAQATSDGGSSSSQPVTSPSIRSSGVRTSDENNKERIISSSGNGLQQLDISARPFETNQGGVLVKEKTMQKNASSYFDQQSEDVNVSLGNGSTGGSGGDKSGGGGGGGDGQGEEGSSEGSVRVPWYLPLLFFYIILLPLCYRMHVQMKTKTLKIDKIKLEKSGNDDVVQETPVK